MKDLLSNSKIKTFKISNLKSKRHDSKNDNEYDNNLDIINTIFIFLIIFTLLFFMTSTIISMNKSSSPFFNLSEIDKGYDKKGFNSKNIALKDTLDSFETSMKENFFYKDDISELYGGYKKLTGSKIVDDPLSDRYVYKGNNGFLYYISHNKKDHSLIAKNIATLQSKLLKDKINFVMVLAPNKHNISSSNFPEGVLDYTTYNTSNFETTLTENGIDTLNLNNLFYEDNLDESKSFYATDTHWKFETSFWAYDAIKQYLGDNYLPYILKNQASSNIENYTSKTFKDLYLGSMGKRTGKYYVDKKDDISMLFPAFDTDLVYKKYDENYNQILEKRGSYKDVFFNPSVIESNNPYEDRYTALMGYGSAFEVIENKKIKDDSSIMIIKDSFAMPVASYLSNDFSKVYLIDNRYENIKKTFYKQVKVLKPDIVIMLVSPTSTTFFPQMFDF